MGFLQELEQFRALIIDPNALTRTYIWEAVLSDRHFSVVTASRNTEDSAAQFLQGYECDVVLISSNIELDKIKEFIQTMRNSVGGREAAIVTVVYAKEQTATGLGSLLAEGSDGLLLSPFSVHSLAQVAEIAKKVKRDFDRKRKVAAAKLMGFDLLLKFDELNRGFARGLDGVKAIDRLRESVLRLEKVLEGHPDVFAEAVRENLSNIEPPKSSYKGPSQRIKKKLEAGAVG
jgi:CheY-like chemotaxis protein